MKARSIKGKSPEEIKSALSKCIADGLNPTLAIVFISIDLNWKAVSELLNDHGIEIFGSTVIGEFTDGNTDQDSAALLLLDMDKSNFKIHLEEKRGKSKLKTAVGIGKAGKETFPNPAFILVSGGSVIDGETVIKGIQATVGQDATIFGGIAGDELRGTKTYLFTNDKSTDDGIITLIINNEKVKLAGLASHGWKPVGTIRTITDCEDAKVYSIDNEPALDIMVKFLGLSLEENPKDHLIHNVGSLDPIQLIRDDGSTVTRAIRYLNTEERSILLAGPVTQGTRIRFSLPPDNNIVEKVTEDSEYVKKDYQAEALIMFSCIGRYYSLGPLISTEIEQVKKVWGSPMNGLFCFGEIGKSKTGKLEFHNNTCCMVALKEN